MTMRYTPASQIQAAGLFHPSTSSRTQQDINIFSWLFWILWSRVGFYSFLVLLTLCAFVTRYGHRDLRLRSHSFNLSFSHQHKELSITDIQWPAQQPHESVLFKKKPLVIWATDYHIATINDLHDLLEPLGVAFVDRSLTPRCQFHGNCGNSSNLKVLTRKNGLSLEGDIIERFYKAYKDDPLMKTVDAFVCYHPTAMCQLYKPFNKSLIVVASTRFELGRYDKDRFQKWSDDLKEIAANPKNFVAANNPYDAKYIQYFTGLSVPVIPSYCGYTGASYNPIKPGFLTFAGRMPPSYHHKFFREEYNATFQRLNLTDAYKFQHFRSVYEHFEFQDLANHQGVIFVPYQLSIMTIFELYRMNIPLFFPSIDLLVQWQKDYLVVKERTFHTFRFRERCNGSVIPSHPSQSGVPDPNDDYDLKSINYWFKLADFYATLPHLVYFDSIEDLFKKLQTTNLRAVSQNMKKWNQSAKQDIILKWKNVLRRVANYSINHPV